MKGFKFLCLFSYMIIQSFAFASQAVSELPSIDSEEVMHTTLSPASADEWQEQKESFHKNGYIWIKNFFSPEQVRLLKEYAKDANQAAMNILALAQNSGTPFQSIVQSIPGTLVIVPEAHNPLQVCRTEDLLSIYPDLHHLIEGTVTSYLGYLLNEPFVLFKDKLNFKWPGGGAFAPHQDFPAFQPFGPKEFISAMVCIDAADYENGCLQVAKNWKATFSDNPELDPTELENGTVILPYVVGGAKHGSIQPQYVEKIDWLPLKVSPGDLVIFDAFVPHYSETNKSSSSRRAMFFTLNKLKDGDLRKHYYYTKRNDPENPLFHFATPTNARGK